MVSQDQWHPGMWLKPLLIGRAHGQAQLTALGFAVLDLLGLTTMVQSKMTSSQAGGQFKPI